MKLKTILFIAAFLFCSQIPLVGASQIIIQDADSTWNSTASYSEDLTNITSGVTPRIPVEYAKTIYHNILISSSDLLNATSSVTPRIVVEYANSSYRKDLNEISTDLENLTSEVASRIIMEYATSNYEKQLIFPEELFNETPNNPPTASFTYTTEGLIATFTSTSNDSDGDIISYHWDFGDGAISTEKNPIHIYPASGKYIVTHTVEDSHGRTNSLTEEIQVSSKITSVSCPSTIAKGLPLHLEVETEEEASITALVGDFSETKYGKLVEFNVDTSGFDTGEYELAINADSDIYKTSVRIFDAKNYREVLHGLTDLERAADDEMHEISRMTGYSFVAQSNFLVME
jgi:PKD repeat protein